MRRRASLGAAMAAVAFLALALATGITLWERSRRFRSLGVGYARVASRMENELISDWVGPDRVRATFDVIHWYDAVAGEFMIASYRPWLPHEPNPRLVACRCGFHASRPPRTAARARPTATE